MASKKKKTLMAKQKKKKEKKVEQSFTLEKNVKILFTFYN